MRTFGEPFNCMAHQSETGQWVEAGPLREGGGNFPRAPVKGGSKICKRGVTKGVCKKIIWNVFFLYK